jgi:hypothetical protein
MSKDIQIYPTEVTGANGQPRSIRNHRELFAMIAIVLLERHNNREHFRNAVASAAHA